MRDNRYSLAASNTAVLGVKDYPRDLDKLLTVDDVAALLKVSRSWVYARTRTRHSRSGERLAHIKIGKYVRFDLRAVQTFLERCRTT
jgi:excisionase family DNA binding protein